MVITAFQIQGIIYSLKRNVTGLMLSITGHTCTWQICLHETDHSGPLHLTRLGDLSLSLHPRLLQRPLPCSVPMHSTLLVGQCKICLVWAAEPERCCSRLPGSGFPTNRSSTKSNSPQAKTDNRNLSPFHESLRKVLTLQKAHSCITCSYTSELISN